MKSCINQLNGTTKYHFLLFLSVPSFLLSFFSLSLSYPLYYVCLDYCTTRATPKSVPISQHVTCKHVQSHEGFSTLVVESLRQKHCIRRAHVFHGENIDMSGNSCRGHTYQVQIGKVCTHISAFQRIRIVEPKHWTNQLCRIHTRDSWLYSLGSIKPWSQHQKRPTFLSFKLGRVMLPRPASKWLIRLAS